MTLELDGGDAAEGYVANLDARGVELWTKAGGRARSILAASVRRVVFSGRDTAAAGSYEAWLRKQSDERGSRLASR